MLVELSTALIHDKLPSHPALSLGPSVDRPTSLVSCWSTFIYNWKGTFLLPQGLGGVEKALVSHAMASDVGHDAYCPKGVGSDSSCRGSTRGGTLERQKNMLLFIKYSRGLCNQQRLSERSRPTVNVPAAGAILLLCSIQYHTVHVSCGRSMQPVG